MNTELHLDQYVHLPMMQDDHHKKPVSPVYKTVGMLPVRLTKLAKMQLPNVLGMK